MSGYNGSQIFSTIYATPDPTEPPHCGVSGGSSYWLTYQPPTNGTMTLDTIGSAYDTVMEVYTYNVPPRSYADLIPITCDNDSVAPLGPSRVQFPVVRARPYLVVVDGVNGARGTAWLNYRLDTNTPPLAPFAASFLTSIVVTNGASVLLAPPVSGAPPLQYSWAKDGLLMTNYNLPMLYLTNVTSLAAGDYAVTITNDLGKTSATIRLKVVPEPRTALAQILDGVAIQFATGLGANYVVEEAPTPSGPWLAWPTNFIGDGQPVSVRLTNSGTRFYRLRVN